MGAQETLFLGASHRNSEVSPPKKERKRREGHQGTPTCPEALSTSRSVESHVKSWDIWAVPGWGPPRGPFSNARSGPHSPRPLESSVSALLPPAARDGMRASATPSLESTRRRRPAPEPGLDFTRN